LWYTYKRAVAFATALQDQNAQKYAALRLRRRFYVQDLFERVDVRVDEHAAIDFHGRVITKMMRVRICQPRFGAYELVLDAKLVQKACNQARFMFFSTGEEPYGHRSPSLPHMGHLFLRMDDKVPPRLH
ncbi:MAG TPA: hypothetical protein VGF69_18985, partial [Thermoanaerobaculia bacterium]